MNNTKPLYPLLCAALLALAPLTACGDDDSDSGQDAATQFDAAMQNDAAVQNDAATAPHPETANCATCHDGVHGNAYDYPECGDCHQLPGIPAFPAGHHADNCTGCHGGSNTGTHAGYDVYLPQGCIDCHTP